jgi:restriction system protein
MTERSSSDGALYRRLMWPTIRAIQLLGGSGTRSEIRAKAIEIGGYSEAEQAEMMPNGRTSRLEYYVSWNLTRFKRIGLLENSERGVWSLAELAASVVEEDMPQLHEKIARAYRDLRRERDEEADPDDDGRDDQGVEGSDDNWKTTLIARMKALEPGAFERLCQRLLREADFEKVEVTGRSGDGGIDGVGLVRLGLLSFPTYFQCKKYEGSVGSSAVRDFRGAMAGRGEKGVIITTATFTPAARQEATRDGVPPIDLIDGDALCDLLKKHQVGVVVQQRIVEDVTVDDAWWSEQTSLVADAPSARAASSASSPR